MQIQVLLFAQARERAGRPRITLELPAGGRVSDALSALERLHPGLASCARIWPWRSIKSSSVPTRSCTKAPSSRCCRR